MVSFTCLIVTRKSHTT